MFEPDKAKSAKSHEMIRAAFIKQMGEVGKYTLAYGYYTRSGIFQQLMYSYVIGFSVADRELVIIPIDSDGNAGDPITLNKSNITSAKYSFQGVVKIKSNLLKKELRFFVPGFTPAALENAYILPIVQKEIAVEFKKFIKESFK